MIENLFFAVLMGFAIILIFSAFLMPKSTGKKIVLDPSGRTRVASVAEAAVVNSLLIDLSNRIRPPGKNLEDRLRKSGYVYATAADFHSRRMTTAFACMVLALMVGLVIGIGVLPTCLIATGATVFGFTAPDRRINGAIKMRQQQLLREMGFGLDRVALLLGSGATIADALGNSIGVGQLFGETCAYISTALKTAQPVDEVIAAVQDSLPETQQLTAFLELIRVGMMQGQELTKPFNSMAKMMRDNLKLEIIRAGQQSKIKVVVITSGFIIIATLIVAVGPAVQTLMGSGLF